MRLSEHDSPDVPPDPPARGVPSPTQIASYGRWALSMSASQKRRLGAAMGRAPVVVARRVCPEVPKRPYESGDCITGWQDQDVLHDCRLPAGHDELCVCFCGLVPPSGDEGDAA